MLRLILLFKWIWIWYFKTAWQISVQIPCVLQYKYITHNVYNLKTRTNNTTPATNNKASRFELHISVEIWRNVIINSFDKRPATISNGFRLSSDNLQLWIYIKYAWLRIQFSILDTKLKCLINKCDIINLKFSKIDYAVVLTSN